MASSSAALHSSNFRAARGAKSVGGECPPALPPPPYRLASHPCARAPFGGRPASVRVLSRPSATPPSSPFGMPCPLGRFAALLPPAPRSCFPRSARFLCPARGAAAAAPSCPPRDHQRRRSGRGAGGRRYGTPPRGVCVPRPDAVGGPHRGGVAVGGGAVGATTGGRPAVRHVGAAAAGGGEAGGPDDADRTRRVWVHLGGRAAAPRRRECWRRGGGRRGGGGAVVGPLRPRARPRPQPRARPRARPWR